MCLHADACLIRHTPTTQMWESPGISPLDYQQLAHCGGIMYTHTHKCGASNDFERW